MNIMLVSVTDGPRDRHRRALGARAATSCSISSSTEGGDALRPGRHPPGIAFGVGIALLIHAGRGLPRICAALVDSDRLRGRGRASGGCFFGIYPAVKAARGWIRASRCGTT
jgi:hypothetical protein